jgi:hypothetical protein
MSSILNSCPASARPAGVTRCRAVRAETRAGPSPACAPTQLGAPHHGKAARPTLSSAGKRRSIGPTRRSVAKWWLLVVLRAGRSKVSDASVQSAGRRAAGSSGVPGRPPVLDLPTSRRRERRAIAESWRSGDDDRHRRCRCVDAVDGMAGRRGGTGGDRRRAGRAGLRRAVAGRRLVICGCRRRCWTPPGGWSWRPASSTCGPSRPRSYRRRTTR